MINVHLNGDIVRCPDIRAIHLRLSEQRLAEGRCKYNFTEIKCSAWLNYCIGRPEVKQLSYFGRCFLSGCELCPMHIKRVAAGSQKKTFKIDNQVYRKMASSAHYLVKESKNKTLFITLTFPKFKKKVSDNEINEYFSRYVENLRTNYDCGGYIAVREFGKTTHRVHFHLLLSIPFIPFPVLNAAWCNCIKDICNSSGRAILSDPKTKFINNPARAMRYVCKYFAKTKGQTSTTRLIFMSNNIIQKPKSMYGSVQDLLTGYKGIYIQQTSDYSTSFRITNSNEFDRFCNNFLYPFFELSYKKNENLYAFPIDSS